jgi:iron complex outermembrane recepter protein
MSKIAAAKQMLMCGGLAGFASAGIGVCIAAVDPSASGPGEGIPEIIVTASRREESVQRAALAVQAFDGDQLRSAGLSQATDINKLVQGLQIATSGSETQIFIRGIGDFSANPLSNPGVAFNVDGVYVGRPEAVASTFYDVSRLEVLKGPQGTLYGRNASGGAINLITNSPSLDTFGGTANLDIGNYRLYHVEGAVNLPVSDTVAIRAAVNRVKRDGYLSDGTNDDDELAGRLKALVKFSEEASLLVSVDGAEIRGRNAGYTYLPQRPGSNPWEGSQSPAAEAYLATFNPLIAPAAQQSFVRNNLYNISAQLDWNLGFATLTVIPAYRHTQNNSLSYDAQSQGLLGTANQETFEVRLSHASDAIKWVAGVYFFDEHNPGEAQINVGPGLLKSRIDYDPLGISYAAFGETTVSLNDRLRMIVGARYTDEKRQLGGNFFLYPTQGDNFVNLETFDGKKTFDSFTWKAGAEYDVAPQSLLFFTASTGFKAGGLSQTVYPDNVYQPERVLAFELGSRNRFLDNRLQVNWEAFHWTYKDQQNSFADFDSLGNLNFLTRNAGKATIYGGNLDLEAKLTQADTFRLAGEYDHSRYQSFSYAIPIFIYNPAATGCRNTGITFGPIVPLIGLDCSAFQLPHTPTWSGLADYSHRFAIGAAGSIEFDANVRAASKTWLGPDFTPTERAPSYVVAGASLTYQPPRGNYSLSVYGRNLNNGKEYTSGYQSAFAVPVVPAIIGPPRTYGAQLHVTW